MICLLNWLWKILDEGGVEVPAFAAAIEQHQKRITDAILEHARQIYADRSVSSVLTLKI